MPVTGALAPQMPRLRFDLSTDARRAVQSDLRNGGGAASSSFREQAIDARCEKPAGVVSSERKHLRAW
jgi:hypothetical protein